MIFTGDIAQPYAGASSYVIPEELQIRNWMGNLEGSLVGGISKREDVKGVYNDLDAIIELQTRVPYRAFNIANNHILDAANIHVTLDNLQQVDVGIVGGGCILQEADKSLLLIDDDGASYRILAFGWESIQCVPASDNRQGVNPYTRENVFRCVESALRNREPIICFFHWDYELEAYPQPYDRQLAMDLIDLGVAAVIGCHAHRIQPIEFYKGKPIVYGLGNFLFCQGHYMHGKLCFPRFCEEEYAFEITKEGYKLHYFHYDLKENKLEYVKSAEISADREFDGKATFTGFSAKEYEKWFKEHRVQKKLLPIFKAHESSFSYWAKSAWIKMRGSMINLLSRMNLKSANRANR